MAELMQALRHPLVIALIGLILGAGTQAIFIGGQMSQRVSGLEVSLGRIHDRLDGLYSRDMADRDLARIQVQLDLSEDRLSQLEARVFSPR